jgi:small subunit ribosomal protein S21
MVYVKRQPGESADSMIKKFSRKVFAEGIIEEVKRREFYLKPSLARKYKKELARKMAARLHGKSQTENYR